MAKFEKIIGEIRKGRRFRRILPGAKRYYLALELELDGVIDGEWELEPITKGISRDDLSNAWSRAFKGSSSGHGGITLPDLIKALGLE